MGGRIAILSVPPVGAEMVLLGEIDDAGVRYADGHGTVGGAGARELKRLLGNGYGRRTFHMEFDGVRLERCRVVSPKMVFTYQAVLRVDELDFDDDEPDTYVKPIDDLGPAGDTADALEDDGPDTWPEYEVGGRDSGSGASDN